VGQFRKNLTATEEQRQKLSSYFIDAKDIVPFLETIEGYGTDTGIEVTFSSVDIKKTPSRLDVGIFAEGDFDDLYRFLSLLEAAPYEITFTEVDVHSNVIEGLVPTGTQPYSAAWSAAITLSVLSISGVQ